MFGHEQYLTQRTILITEKQYIFEFPNNYGASVICNSISRGKEDGLWELAVLHNGEICYTTDITGDVIGWLKEDEVEALLKKIKGLGGENK
jgi:hypothetical protein